MKGRLGAHSFGTIAFRLIRGTDGATEGGMGWVAAGVKVGEQVKDLLLAQSVEQAGRHE